MAIGWCRLIILDNYKTISSDHFGGRFFFALGGISSTWYIAKKSMGNPFSVSSQILMLHSIFRNVIFIAALFICDIYSLSAQLISQWQNMSSMYSVNEITSAKYKISKGKPPLDATSSGTLCAESETKPG